MQRLPVDLTVGRRTEDLRKAFAPLSSPFVFLHHGKRRLPPPRADDTCRHQAHMYICICSRAGGSVYVAAYTVSGELEARWSAMWRNQTVFTVLKFIISFHCFFFHLCATYVLRDFLSDWDTVGFMQMFPKHWELRPFGVSPGINLVKKHFNRILNLIHPAASAASAATLSHRFPTRAHIPFISPAAQNGNSELF